MQASLGMEVGNVSSHNGHIVQTCCLSFHSDEGRRDHTSQGFTFKQCKQPMATKQYRLNNGATKGLTSHYSLVQHLHSAAAPTCMVNILWCPEMAGLSPETKWCESLMQLDGLKSAASLCWWNRNGSVLVLVKGSRSAVCTFWLIEKRSLQCRRFVFPSSNICQPNFG